MKCCEYFNMFLQGLFSQQSNSCIQAGEQRWLTQMILTWGQIIYLSPAACPGPCFERPLLPRGAALLLLLAACTACSPLGHRLGVPSLQMPSPPSSSLAPGCPVCHRAWCEWPGTRSSPAWVLPVMLQARHCPGGSGSSAAVPASTPLHPSQLQITPAGPGNASGSGEAELLVGIQELRMRTRK